MTRTKAPKLNQDECDRHVALIIQEMAAMPQSVALRVASNRYNRKTLDAAEPRMRATLCRALVQHFATCTGETLNFWKTQA